MLQILLVEDNPVDVLMVRETLRASAIPADLLVADDGEQALKLLNDRQVKFDFIILDLAMPKFDGFMRARTDLCGGRSAMVVPTATLVNWGRKRDQPFPTAGF